MRSSSLLLLLCLTIVPVTAQMKKSFQKRVERPVGESSFTLRSTKEGGGTTLDPVWQVNLEVKKVDGEMKLQVVPEAVTNGMAMVFRPDVDSWMRELTYAFRDLDKRVRANVDGTDLVAAQWLTEKKPLTGQFRLSIRKLNGKVLFHKKLAIWFEGAEKGMLRVTYKKEGEEAQKLLSIDDLGSPEGYAYFLDVCTHAFELGTYPWPKVDQFIVELSIRHQEVNGCNNRFPEKCRTALSKYLRTWVPPKNFSAGYPNCLGTTLCSVRNGDLTQVHSPYWKRFGENQEIKKEAWRLAEAGQFKEAAKTMETYFITSPSDRHAARLRVDYYDKLARREQAYPLIKDYQPYFLSFREPNQLTHPQLAKQRAELKQQRDSFTRSPEAWLHITKPSRGDLIAGRTAVEMIIKDNHQPILSIDAFLDGTRVASIENPPARLFIDPADTGDHQLKVVAYFEDGSYCDDKMSLKSVVVDESEEVNLVRAQVSATRRGSPVKDLEKDDFKVVQNGQTLNINGFSKQAKPLKIIVLMDSSISMALKNIFPARQELYRFLKELPDHATSVYSFENRVTQLKRFDESLDEVAPLIQTITADGRTALYDALLAARGQLLGDRDTVKVLIVITDGAETQSLSNNVQVSDLLDQSAIMVYSIYISRNDSFLESLANRNGGFAQKAQEGRDMEKAFDRIIKSLGAIYFINYYSPFPHQEKVKIKAKGASLLWKIHR